MMKLLMLTFLFLGLAGCAGPGIERYRGEQPALDLQRKAQWRLDFIAAENSMGFHAPQEAAMVLGEAIDYARQGELVALRYAAPKAEAVAQAK